MVNSRPWLTHILIGGYILQPCPVQCKLTECTNILWKLARRGNRTPEDVQADVRDLISLALDRIDTVPLLPDILHLATEHDISVYDATYVLTAQLLGIPLLTADERLPRKLVGKDGQVVLLAELR